MLVISKVHSLKSALHQILEVLSLWLLQIIVGEINYSYRKKNKRENGVKAFITTGGDY